jgi:glycosyltransferase involved in cell wall biosynthesis
VFYYPYEPDYDQIRRLPPDAVEAVARRFGLAPERRRIVYSGRLAAEKRVDLLIAAFVALAADRPDWDLLVIGDGPLRAALAAGVPENLAPRVTWAGFVDDQETVGAMYRACHVLVLPSDYEPWALVVNEAVAAGLAVVCSNVVGAAAELVVDGVNGRLFPPGDLVALTAGLRDVTTPATLDAMRAAAYGVLADWRRRGDPINGLRSALALSGIVTSGLPG